MSRGWLCALAVAALATAAPARADHLVVAGDAGTAGSHGAPSFMNEVFSPKMVMEHQQEIGLRPEQAEAIKTAMADTQQKLLDLQWRLDAETEALAKLLAADQVDEAAAIASLDRVTAIEREVKRVNFALLVTIKNQLDREQQAKLRAYRPRRTHEPPPGPPPSR
jgi:Spy/CpxP family protein refolding chaperone